MKLQVLHDKSGNQTGVYVPMEDWSLIKANYPDIESLDEELPLWEKGIIDARLELIAKNPQKVRPLHELVEELRREI
jgi:hypothetical protein